MTRREWLTTVTALAAGACAHGRTREQVPAAGRSINTATGPVAPSSLGLTLMHEHVLVDFVGAERVSRERYDADAAFAVILPHLRQARELGCETLVECTPAYLGRDAALLRRLSEASGLRILTNTGYYGAAGDKHLPPHAWTESAEQLAARWTREYEQGLDGTSVRPAFMKIGVDAAPLSEVDRKLVRAAALTHRATGLAIASHTPTGAGAMEELSLLAEMDVPARAFIWVHAHGEKDESFHTRAAESGAWVEFDGLGPQTVERHVALVRRMKEQRLLGRVLVSHDAGWYRVGEPGGGQFRAFDTLFTAFRPAAAAAGLTEQDLRQLLIDNPRAALSQGA